MLNILICEDEKKFLEELTGLVGESLGGQVRTVACNSMAEFKKATEKNVRDFDMALMDICLGESDGIENRCCSRSEGGTFDWCYRESGRREYWDRY